MNEEVLRKFNKRRGAPFSRADKVAEFFVRERIRFDPAYLDAWGNSWLPQVWPVGRIHHIPEWVARAFVELAKGVSPKAICDPWAGIGFLIGVLRQACRPKEGVALAQDRGDYAIGKALVPEVEWHVGEPLRLLDLATREFDLVASVLLMGLRAGGSLTVSLPSGETVDLSDDLGNLIMVSASLHLSSDGLGLFVVTPSFFVSSQSVFRQFGALGLGIEAAIALPSGTFAPFTNIGAYLLLVRRKLATRMFVAELSSDQKTNLQVFNNFRQKQEGGTLELGRFVDPQSFRGLSALRAEDQIRKAQATFGTRPARLVELAQAINLGRFDPQFEFPKEKNALFIPLIGGSDVVESPDDLTLKKQNYAQVVVNPKHSSAHFVARFLNSEFGKDMRQAKTTGATNPRLNKQTLSEILVFVPDLRTQAEILEIEARIATEQNTLIELEIELSDLRDGLWSSPVRLESVKQGIAAFARRLSGDLAEHASGRLDQWFETLPFPLASILRAWQATPTDDLKTKYEHLLHFFEATAEFFSVILLSAFSSNEALFGFHKQNLGSALQKQNLSFQRPTFGAWKLVVEYLGKQTRQLLSESGKNPEDAHNDRAVCADIFSDSSLVLAEVLSRKELAAILSTTNKMRNDWSGHGGVVGQTDAQLRNQSLLAEVQKLREALANVWIDAQLIQALHCRPRRGIFENEVAIQMGSNSEFLKETRAMATWLDVERLYVSKKDSGRALKLLPLIQIGPSPASTKNACYFFNRLEPDGARFVSYHFTERPELTGQFDEAADVIRSLAQI